MSGVSPELVEKVALVLVGLDHADDWFRGFGATLDELAEWEANACRDAARAILEAVADDLRADAWDDALQAAAWCLDNGSESATTVLAYAHKNNPHRTKEEL